MKAYILILIVLFTAVKLYSQKGVELMNLSVARAGSLEQISKPLLNLQEAKLGDYDSLHMIFTGNWGMGQSYSVSCSPTGDTIFAGTGAAVIIFDASNPYNPVKLSEIHARALVDGSSYDPANKLLYLAAYFSGIEVWDLSDIYNPKRIGRAPATGLPRGGVHFRNSSNGYPDYAYLVNVVNGVDVYNVIDPGNPVKASNYNFTANLLVWNSFKSEDRLFVPAGASGTKIIELSASPVLTNPFNINTASNTIHVIGDLAYIVYYAYGLKIYNIGSFPATLLGQIQQEGYPYQLTVFDGTAFVANPTTNAGGGINIFDVSNPSLPQNIANQPGYRSNIAGAGQTVYATGGSDNCLFLDVAVPSSPSVASTYTLPVSTWDVAVSGNFAYSGSNGFRVYDISNKQHPVQVGYHSTLGDNVEISGNLAVYCPESMGSNNKVNIMDISDPYNPQKLAHYTAPVMTNDISLKDHYAFIACWWDGFRVIDFSNPSSPVLVAQEMGWVNGAIPGVEWCYVQALDVDGNFLYVVDYQPFEDQDTKGVYIFDITEPANPQFLSRFPFYTGKAYDIKASNGFAYLADSQGGLNVIDANDPENSYEAGYIMLGDAAYAVDVFGNYAFVANYINEGVQVIDILNPTAPYVAGYYKRSGCFAVNVTYDAGHVYVSDGPAGFGIYRFDLLSGINEGNYSNQYHVAVQPNPAKDKITVTVNLNNPEILSIELYTLEGMLIKHLFYGKENHGLFSGTFHIGNNVSGIYLLKIRIGRDSIAKKVILL